MRYEQDFGLAKHGNLLVALLKIVLQYNSIFLQYENTQKSKIIKKYSKILVQYKCSCKKPAEDWSSFLSGTFS